MSSEAAPHLDRQETVAALSEQPLDVLVVGGGIVGAGVARDAAMRGLRVALIEQHDFAFGTSSRTSRLLHGGLRYLAQGRVGLVAEASREKRVIHEIAPHLARPLPFVFPTYRGTRWPRWQLRVGVKLYDMLCGGQNFGPSRGLTRDETTRLVAGLESDRLTGAVRYFDGFTNDARLVIDTLRSAGGHAALLLSYARLAAAAPEETTWRCDVADHLDTGNSYRIEARAVVNATGPWSQQVPHSSVRLRLTKGVHLVVERPRLPVPEAVVMTRGDRILFAIPWSDRTILGTTDTDYTGPLDDVRAAAEDVDYVLEVANATFPAAGLRPSDVVSTWAGLRPLVAASGGGPSDISRAHEIRMPEPGWIDVAGGKLTTYRLIAQQVVDRLVRHLDLRKAPCRSAQLPLLGPDRVGQFSGIRPPEVIHEVVRHCCREEWAEHLDDLMLRRTGWHYYYKQSDQIAQQAATWMAEEKGWDEQRRQEELERYRRLTA